MQSDPLIREIFGRFQNLNLLALLGDLRDGRTAQQNWQFSSLLCLLSHGMPAGYRVARLQLLSQESGLEQACVSAAGDLGADPCCVSWFVRFWDSDAAQGPFSAHGLLVRQLEAIWKERLEDAEAMQEMLAEKPLHDASAREADHYVIAATTECTCS